eukprot:2939254-Pyramimonas_sp.AAC.1
MVDHQGAVARRGGDHGHRKDTCTEASAYAEVSYPNPASLLYYTPKVHTPTPLGNFFGDTMHGTMRYESVPPAPLRKLTVTPPSKQQQPTIDTDVRGHWINVTIFGILWVGFSRVVGHMQRGADDTRTTGPQWDPAGTALFRECAREVHAWITVTTGTMNPFQ